VGTVLDIADLLKIPDMITAAETSEPVDWWLKGSCPCSRVACLELVAMREKEGDVLAADLAGRIRAFFPGLAKIKELIPVRQQEYAAKMRARVQELSATGLIAGSASHRNRTHAERLDRDRRNRQLEAHLHHFLDTLAFA